MNNSLKLFLRIALFFTSAVAAQAQGTSFSYQGRLSNGGNPANGNYYMSFALFNAAQAGNQIAGPTIQGPVSVSNGLFSVTLSFPESAAFDGSPRWLEIRVIEENEAGPATLLAPRQQILATPYATTAANLSGVLPESKLPSNVARLNANQILDVAGAVAVNGTTIIDAAGNWIGNTAGLSLNTLRSGSGSPNNNLGATGDFYIDTSTKTIFGPKSGQGGNRWGNGTAIVGPMGPQGIQGVQGIQGPIGLTGPRGLPGPTSVLNGIGVPSFSLGTNGDFYIDTTAHAIYGPKTSGGWGVAVSLIGPQGPTGAQGPPGINTYAACGSTSCGVVCAGRVQSSQSFSVSSGRAQGSCQVSSTTGGCSLNITWGGGTLGSETWYCCVCEQN